MGVCEDMLLTQIKFVTEGFKVTTSLKVAPTPVRVNFLSGGVLILQNWICFGRVAHERRSARVVNWESKPAPTPTIARVVAPSERTESVAKY